MNKEDNKPVEQNETNQKPAAAEASKKKKKKVTADSINRVIKSATGQVRADSAGSHLKDGTWVDYEEDK